MKTRSLLIAIVLSGNALLPSHANSEPLYNIDGLVVKSTDYNKDDIPVFLKMLSALTGGAYSIDEKTGQVAITDGHAGTGKSADRINTILADKTHTTTIWLALPGLFDKTTIGRWRGGGTQSIDVRDVGKFPTDATKGIDTQSSILIHEIYEAYQGALGATSDAAHIDGVSAGNEELKEKGGTTYGQRYDLLNGNEGPDYFDVPFITPSKPGSAPYYERIWFIDYDVTKVEVALKPIPEPSTYAMALTALACGGWQMFRRRRSR